MEMVFDLISSHSSAVVQLRNQTLQLCSAAVALQRSNYKQKSPDVSVRTSASGASRNRTRDTRIFSPLLYQLS